MKQPFPEDQKAAWHMLLRENSTVKAVIGELQDLTPNAFDPGKDGKMESVALRSAHAQGWRDCLQALQDLATKRVTEIDSPFLEMNDDQPEKKT